MKYHVRFQKAPNEPVWCFSCLGDEDAAKEVADRLIRDHAYSVWIVPVPDSYRFVPIDGIEQYVPSNRITQDA